MKKFLLSAFALLLCGGVAFAHSVGVNPQNGPMQVVVPVYNNDSTTIAAGDVVVWDIGSSTGDDDNYIVDTTTANTSIVAGIMAYSTATKKTGAVITYGVTDCDVVGAGGVAAGDLLCTSTTAGEAQACSHTNKAFAFGYALTSGADTTVKCFVNP